VRRWIRLDSLPWSTRERVIHSSRPTSAFALVELSRVALEELMAEAAGRLVERLDTLPERIQSSGASVAVESRYPGMQRVVEMLTESRRTIASDTEQAQRRIAEQTGKASKIFPARSRRWFAPHSRCHEAPPPAPDGSSPAP